MPISTHAMCAVPGDLCAVAYLPLDCAGEHVDLVTGLPVAWSDPFPAGGRSGVGVTCHLKTLTLEPEIRDDEILNEDECDEVTLPGGVKWWEGEWTLGRVMNLQAEAVMGIAEMHVDKGTLLPAASPARSSSVKCLCSAGSCQRRFAMVTVQPMQDRQGTALVPLLDPNTGLPVLRWQVYPGLRATTPMPVNKTRRLQDLDDRTTTIRSGPNPALWDQWFANRPPWMPSAVVDSLDEPGGAFDPLDPADARSYQDTHYVSFYSSAAPVPGWAANCDDVCGWLNDIPAGPLLARTAKVRTATIAAEAVATKA